MSHVDAAVELFGRCNCAQAVLMSRARELGLKTDQAARLAYGFGAGMARRGEVCGALSGAIMVLGMRIRPEELSDPAYKEKFYGQVTSLIKTFEAKNKFVRCRDLTGADLNTPEGQEKYKKELHKKLCTGLVRQAVEMLDEMGPDKREEK
jgi:C_GCAxxG_C_C family probable redox protein